MPHFTAQQQIMLWSQYQEWPDFLATPLADDILFKCLSKDYDTQHRKCENREIKKNKGVDTKLKIFCIALEHFSDF